MGKYGNVDLKHGISLNGVVFGWFMDEYFAALLT
jgi:F0F1-type ATP synthase assembly protein I